jgi:hypothetical protein
MVTQNNKNLIVISRKNIQKRGGVVILDLKQYQRLCERAVPTYYLKGKKAGELDKLVETGLRDYRKGKCRSLQSLADLD